MPSNILKNINKLSMHQAFLSVLFNSHSSPLGINRALLPFHQPPSLHVKLGLGFGGLGMEGLFIKDWASMYDTSLSIPPASNCSWLRFSEWEAYLHMYIHMHTEKSISQTIYTLIYLQVYVYEYILVSKLYIHTICVNISINKVLGVNGSIFTYHLYFHCLLKQTILSTSIHPHTCIYKLASNVKWAYSQIRFFKYLICKNTIYTSTVPFWSSSLILCWPHLLLVCVEICSDETKDYILCSVLGPNSLWQDPTQF